MMELYQNGQRLAGIVAHRIQSREHSGKAVALAALDTLVLSHQNEAELKNDLGQAMTVFISKSTTNLGPQIGQTVELIYDHREPFTWG